MMGGFISVHAPLDLINIECLALHQEIYMTCLTCFCHYSSLRFWALNGQETKNMSGHTATVCSVDSLASGLIVSGSEDRSAKIWKGNDFFLFDIIFIYCFSHATQYC